MYKQSIIVLIIVIYVNNNADSFALAPHAVAGVAVSIGQVSNSLKVRLFMVVFKGKSITRGIRAWYFLT